MESNSGKPTYLQLGTKVLAKYNGTFREAKIKKLIRCVKCKVTFKNDYVPLTVTDEDIRGEFRVGATVETKHPERNVFCEAIINNIIDHSQYIVVFDDSNEITLKTSLCLKSGNPGLENGGLCQTPEETPKLKKNIMENLTTIASPSLKSALENVLDLLERKEIPSGADWDLLLGKKQIAMLEEKIAELEHDIKEAREHVEFLTSERTILIDSLKEYEDNAGEEKAKWEKDRLAFEELGMRSKRLYDKVIAKNDKIKELQSKLDANESLVQRASHEARENRALFESICASLKDFKEDFASSLHYENGEGNNNLFANYADLPSDIAVFRKMFKDVMSLIDIKEYEELKQDANNFISENVELKSKVKQLEILLKGQQNEAEEIKSAYQTSQENVVKLNRELDKLFEKSRVNEALNNELREQIDELNLGSNMQVSQNPLILRQEVARLKEIISCKEEMLEKLSAKYSRNKDVWVENELKAVQEIKKLDDIIDQVVMTLKSIPHVVSSDETLSRLFEMLSEETDADPQEEDS